MPSNQIEKWRLFCRSFGFEFDRNSKFFVGDKKYRLGKRGVQVLNGLANIAARQPSRDNTTWLLPLRGRIRELEMSQSRVFLTIVASQTNNLLLHHLAIWIRGRCGGDFGVPTLAELYPESNRETRRRIARCLQKLGAWAELRHILEIETDTRIRRIATQSTGRTFEERRAKFLRHIPRQPFSPNPPPLFVSPEVDFQQGKPAKPLSMIRDLLKRIRRLVSGWTR